MKRWALIAGALLVGIAATAFLTARTNTPAFRAANGNILEGSIAQERKVDLGGWPQYVLIRGRNRDNPLLVFVHGGPGTTEMPMTRLFNFDLENDFIFVNWDQRGTGKSYSRHLDPKSLTLDQLVRDLDELIELLSAEFKQEKILLICHSWGTHLGLEYVTRYPEKVSAYIGIGQVTNPVESDRLGTIWALNKAKEAGDMKAVRDLEDLGAGPYSVEKTILQRKYIWKYGGAFYEPKSITEMIRTALKASEISWRDFFSFKSGTEMSTRILWPEIMGINAEEDYPRLEVPVYFMLGRFDMQVSSQLAAQYFEKLEAPHKQLIWFEKSAHSPPFEEPELFNARIMQIAREFDLLANGENFDE